MARYVASSNAETSRRFGKKLLNDNGSATSGRPPRVPRTRGWIIRRGGMRGVEVLVVLGIAVALGAVDAGAGGGLVNHGQAVPGAASPAAEAMLGVLGEHSADRSSSAALWFRHGSALRWPGWLDALAERAGPRVALRAGTVVIANLDYPADRDNVDAIRTAAGELGLPVEDLNHAARGRAWTRWIPWR